MSLGRILIVAGGTLVAAGVVLLVAERLPFRLGQLPGDIVLRGKSGTLYYPVVPCIILSLILSGIVWLLGRRG